MKISKASNGRLLFYCPGCKCHHGVTDSWQFNNDFNNPTFSPSILVRSTMMTEKGEADYEAWRTAGCPKTNEVFEHVPTVCHSFVTNGKIQYLSDCTHELAAHIIEMVDMD
jgi:hypothetical protein